jgi:type IV pilus assembly protein PilC
LAKKLFEEADMALARRVERVEPMLVLVTSVLVGVVLLLVMLPLINIMETIG